jgi:hypothetical protein
MSLGDPGPSIGMSKNRPTRTRADASQNPAAANANMALANVAMFISHSLIGPPLWTLFCSGYEPQICPLAAFPHLAGAIILRADRE